MNDYCRVLPNDQDKDEDLISCKCSKDISARTFCERNDQDLHRDPKYGIRNVIVDRSLKFGHLKWI